MASGETSISGPMIRPALDRPLAHLVSVTHAVNSVVAGPTSAPGSSVHVAGPLVTLVIAEQAASTATARTANTCRAGITVKGAYR